MRDLTGRPSARAGLLLINFASTNPRVACPLPSQKCGLDRMDLVDGVIVVDKPSGISSHDAVRKMRWLASTRKVGHLGTLDPLGTGVLPLVINKATRLSKFFLNHEREYEAKIRFGWATDSYDRDGDPVGDKQEVDLDQSELEDLIEDFRGVQSQMPPAISAKKINGVPAYKLARRNQEVNLEPVEIEIYELEVLDVHDAMATIRCRCSAGTYVRSLAHDLGQRLGCGAHVETLRRTLMGDFKIEDAHTIEELETLKEQDRLDEAFLPLEGLLPEFPVHRVDAVTANQIEHGRDFRVSPFGNASDARQVKAVGPRGNLICIGEAVMPRLYHPIVVL